MALRIPNEGDFVPVHLASAETVKAVMVGALEDGRIVAKLTQMPFIKGSPYKKDDMLICEDQADEIGTRAWEATGKYEPDA